VDFLFIGGMGEALLGLAVFGCISMRDKGKRCRAKSCAIIVQSSLTRLHSHLPLFCFGGFVVSRAHASLSLRITSTPLTTADPGIANFEQGSINVFALLLNKGPLNHRHDAYYIHLGARCCFGCSCDTCCCSAMLYDMSRPRP